MDTLKTSGERIIKSKVRHENGDIRDKDGARLVETGGQHTFHTQRIGVDTRDAHRGRERGRKAERGREKVGYHSGSWLLEIAAPMPLLPLPASLPSLPPHR